MIVLSKIVNIIMLLITIGLIIWILTNNSFIITNIMILILVIIKGRELESLLEKEEAKK